MGNIKGLKKVNKDGWYNVYTMMGVHGKDKATGTGFRRNKPLTENYLNALYSDEGIVRKAVDRPVMDMLKEGFFFDGDSDGELLSYYNNNGFHGSIKDQLTWDRLHGGALLLIGLEDGKDLEEEVDFGKIKSILYLKSYERWRVVVDESSFVEDPQSKLFGKPEFYEIYPRRGIPFRVHYSRVFISDGLAVTDDTREFNNGIWGDSIVQAAKRYVERFAHTYDSTDSILDDFVQAVLRIDNLQELISNGQEDEIRKRLEILSLGKNQLQTMLIANGEEYTKESSSVTGIDKVLQEFSKGLAAVWNMPLTLLMGMSPGGMNSTGESDIRLWYDFVGWLQDQKLKPVIIWINKFIFSSKENNISLDSSNVTVRFNPLWKPSPKEQAETRKINAETDMIYEEMGVLTRTEIRASRFNEQGDYSDSIFLDHEISDMEEDPNLEEMSEEEKKAMGNG